MKITKIEFENFRNFKSRNAIHFSSGGPITIIYGKNGEGKTTLHQLFQWILYGDTHFNKTANTKLYNLEFEKETEYGNSFTVFGEIDFEHNGKEYSVRREANYRKQLDDSTKLNEEFTVRTKDSDFNWSRISDEKGMIEEVLPSGLAEYFFFDGESMIADLRMKGSDSASKLRTALFSIFGLNLLQDAINNIGSKELKTTVLGQLFIEKSSLSSADKHIKLRKDMEISQSTIDNLKYDLEKNKKELEEMSEFIKTASERIGGTVSTKEYELERANLKLQRDIYLNDQKKAQEDYGAEVVELFPMLFASKVTERVEDNYGHDTQYIFKGLTRDLIDSLLKSENCICGCVITEKEIHKLEQFIPLLPPNFTFILNNFIEEMQDWQEKATFDHLGEYIYRSIEKGDKARDIDLQISKLDADFSNRNKDLEDLIDQRHLAELRVRELNDIISDKDAELGKLNGILNSIMNQIDKYSKGLAANQLIDRKISIMQEVKKYFELQLQVKSEEYSKELELQIQRLMDKMLNSKRTVTVSNDFTVRITDSYDDESKSEGQFAVASFAYIGGILSLLEKVPELKNKEFPLVLDGPFSKLGQDHRESVTLAIPEFATQVIIFSKDDLQEYFQPEVIGGIWTLKSNSEKNVAEVKEGFLW